MQQFEKDYAALVADILTNGESRETRNAKTISVFGRMLKVDCSTNAFPILQGRKYFPKGVLGEFAAIIRQPTKLSDFVDQGCNYWKKWAKEDGSINVDYGNAWFNFEGFDQVAELKRQLKEDPTNRRMIITGWNPSNLENLDLPCCHMLYQFYVREGKYLDMVWYQRSVDTMIGLPADIVLAAIWLITLANECELRPGEVTMMLGDTHIYEAHTEGAAEYVRRVKTTNYDRVPTYMLNMLPGQVFESFEPEDLCLSLYPTLGPIDLELFA